MAAYATQLLRREEVAEGTCAFHFARPSGFAYRAGQNAVFTLAEPPPQVDVLGLVRTFSIASAPHERDLMIATRMRDSSCKRALGTARPGTVLQMDGPAGELALHDDAARPAVFIAGGIGITPFLSIARDAARRALPHVIRLFYSNRRPEDAAFLGELRELQLVNRNFSVVATMTEMHRSSVAWSGQSGAIGPRMLERHLAGLRAPIYYLAGPPGMTMTMQAMLNGMGVPDEDVRSEDFFGY